MNTMNPGGKERPTRVHHLNCGSMMSIEATYEGPPPLHAVCHCLLVETDRDGLVLIETGLGLDDVRRPQDSLDPEWRELAQPELRPAETARQQIERLGYAASDVRHIALTHLDVDHCGGLPDFPEAQVHLMASELRAAMAEAPSFRYRPAHWAHGPRWVTYEPDSAGGEEWAGFAGVRPLTGVASEVLMMPLGGHSAGHAGFAVRDGEGWLLHAGDAYFYHREIAADDPHSHPLMDLIQLNAQVEEELRIANQGRLREAAAGGAGEERIRVINAHDPWDFRSLGGA
ncbi:MBL fold metallo-hydrolase [Streptomyces hygroscopicus]|uniref:MBL fold metallo-hydrolase n=1 Tax=Streptomyces hygroscopicus TaxID=1912 RepID=UPI001FCA8DAD|nr:MBL fold metallo-hydrolase [Streptomyces hygroscopicus]BDH13992.1 MBL fold metallo-hydrolase [Streptomyces hygroscopicus]